ncbi:MAG: redoxin domain-containing protein [bacterium]
MFKLPQKRNLFLTLTLLLMLFGFSRKGAAQPGVGDPAPNFTLIDLDGDTVSLSDYSGLVILLYFFGYS